MGLSSQSECSPCPSGKFCTSGVISGDCQDGFYCRLGADRPDPPAATDCNDAKNAGPCPPGFYCSDQTNHIEVPCEPGTFSDMRASGKFSLSRWRVVSVKTINHEIDWNNSLPLKFLFLKILKALI